MAPEQQDSSTDDTSGQEQQETQDQQQAPTPDNGGNGEQQQSAPAGEHIQLPDTHPLVKQLAANKQKLATQGSELQELRATSRRVTELETELNARPTQEAIDTLQTRYDRLEAFLIAAGGDLSTALDSRTFTRELFETDTDIAQIVKDWHKAHPSATSKALGSGGAEPADKKPDMNELLRAAFKSQ
jgi:hypothetical protein